MYCHLCPFKFFKQNASPTQLPRNLIYTYFEYSKLLFS